ncbi:type II secretion system protein GspL [Marinospirillum insulare]|uniref:GspL cytoplasmic actin-ATPase-like domain-containing protein n=1 Tax=Marinospirillum insulare TaxID=217169 RepID=A0ABQ5ZSY5_9GAMM|nr:type II secretion system protein GspL [Marinospirillum insulare]GLR63079.1 hypothetical protein GCM10007878_05140 [Marinospirillum insulare]
MKVKQPLLVIRLAVNSSQDEYWWLPEGAAASSLTAEQAASFSKTTPALVLLDAAAIRLDKLALPPGVKTNEAALLLEDQLSQPLEDVDVLILEKKGRELKVASLDKLLAKQWQARLADKNISVARWVPEALCLAELWQEPEPLLLIDKQQARLWNSQEQTLLTLPLAWINSSNNVSEAAPLLAADTQQVNIADLPQQALVPWLATGIPAKLNLWSESFLMAWLNKLPIKNLLTKSLQLTPKQWFQASPWLLLVVVLMSQQMFIWLAKPVSEANPVDVGQALQRLDRRLDNYTNHLNYQQQRMDAWQQLLNQLQSKQHIQVAALVLNEQGLIAKLQGVKPTEQTALKSLTGRWQFSAEQATWEVSL